MWKKMSVFFVGTISAVFAVHFFLGGEIKDSAAIIGTYFTAISIYLAVISIRHTHEWNRRNLTIQLMGNWNQQTRSHLDIIINAFPDFATRPQTSASDEWVTDSEWVHPQWHMNKERAKEILSSVSNSKCDSDDKDIYKSLVSLLNYFESLASAYENAVVDRVVIEQSFAPMIIDVSRYFRPFINLKLKQAGRDPWPPLSKAVKAWEIEHLRKKAEEAIDHANKKKEIADDLAKSPGRMLKEYLGF